MLKRLLIAAAALALVAAAPAQAQLTSTGAGKKAVGGGGGGSYTGPGDVVASAVIWGGLRAYNAAYASSLGNAVELCTAADALCTIIHVTSAGALNSSDLTTSGCSSITTCTVKTVYDQTGGGHNWSQATIGTRPTFDPNGVSSGKPAMRVGGATSQNMVATGISSTSTPYSFASVSMQNATTGGNIRVFTAVDPIGILYSASDHFSFDAGSAPTSSTVTSSHGTYYAVIGRTDGSGSGGVMSVSGTTTTGLSPGNTATGTTSTIFYSGGNLDSAITEFGWWGKNFSSGETTSMNGNMQTYWGI